MQYKNTIEVLSPSVVEKIAAGEVVERPASVIKELVENSIDADATRIDVFIEDAGFSLIKVIDNGCGMNPSDLQRCVLPHATSKIKHIEDIFTIASMGFRGEALASIGAVSRMSVCSCIDGSGLGYELNCNGGETSKIHPLAHARGTTISIKDLFFNVPARKKFMKSRRGEQLAIVKMMEQLVLPFPSIHFTLSIDGKKILDTPFCDNPFERIAEIAGAEFAKKLICCNAVKPDMETQIYVSTPQRTNERPRFQSLYVNLRRIDNDSVTFAIREAFSQFIGFGIRPSFFCFLNVDPSKIDVNVHPTKQQVKFDNERDLFGLIYSAVKQGITLNLNKTQTISAPLDQKTDSTQINQNLNSNVSLPFMVREKQEPIQNQPPFSFSENSNQQTVLSFPGSVKQAESEYDQTKESNMQLTKDVQWDLISCYQIHNMFILAPIKNGILLIDQHAAHERVLYEQALEDIVRGRSASQQLLFPVVMELSTTERMIIQSGQSYFNAFGFEISDFGARALSISAIPAFLKNGSVEETIRDIIKYLMDGKNPDSFSQPEKRFAAAFACGAAIKAGQKLSQEEMNALLNSLFSAKNPYICPHGRPTVVRISIDELSRRFLR
ncbi:MAG: DNA mismatch repair endonuclease MutL [Fibrobacter sp.]|jgi:DNA mismatch repair protein MutL|nr:DNA mismatch repair endonuclease MutL [Fibrobacter sp.]